MGTDLLSIHVSLINSGLLVFFRLILYQGVCFKAHKFLWLSIFEGSFLRFPTVILSFLPLSTPPPQGKQALRARPL